MATRPRTQEVFVEKISRIIPANARTRSAEVSASQPARPGAPATGRPMGKVTKTPVFVEDRLTLSKDVPGGAPTPPPTYQNPKLEAKRAQVVEDLAKKFFESNPKTEVRDNDLTKSEEVVKNIESAQASAPEVFDVSEKAAKAEKTKSNESTVAF